MERREVQGLPRILMTHDRGMLCDADVGLPKTCKEPPAKTMSPEEAPELHLYPCPDAPAKAKEG